MYFCVKIKILYYRELISNFFIMHILYSDISESFFLNVQDLPLHDITSIAKC